MNHIYKSIFNKALGVFTAVPEFASAHGKGSERTVVGRVAKGAAGFAASALAISIGLALTSTSAVAYPGIYINDRQAGNCLAINDTAVANLGVGTILDVNSTPGSVELKVPGTYAPQTGITPSYYNAAGSARPCAAIGNSTVDNRETQTNRTLFYGGPGAATEADEVNNENNGAKNLTLGGRLDVNSGIIGVGDRGVNGAGATNSIRMGTGTTLDESNKLLNAISIGVNSGVNTASSVAIGYGAKAGQADKFSGERSIAVGYNAQALGTAGIAIGEESATTNGHNGVAIGAYSKTSNEKAISIGAFNAATGAQSIVMAGNYDTNSSGPVSVASGTRATVIGAETTVSGNNSLAIGDKNTVASNRTYAIGNNINVAAGANDSLVFGTKAAVGGASSIALGSNTKTYTDDSISIGSFSESGGPATTGNLLGTKAIAIGYETKALATSAVALGYGATVENGHDSIAIGVKAKTSTQKSTTIGSYSEARGDQSTVIANNYDSKAGKAVSIASGARSQVYGAETTVSGNNSVAIGDTNTVTSNRTYAMGNNITTSAGAHDSLAFGTQAYVGNASAIAMGNTAKAVGKEQISIGKNAGADSANSEGNYYGVYIGSEAGRYQQGDGRNYAIGQNAGQYVKGSSNIALGTNAGKGEAGNVIDASSTIAIGRDTKASGYSGISIGTLAETTHANSIALGDRASATNGHDALAVGAFSKTTAAKAMSIGSYSTASGAQSIVIASNYADPAAPEASNRSTATAARAIVMGPESHATAEDALAIGNKNTVASARTYAIGNNINVAAGADDSLVFGTQAAVGAANTVAIGANANAAQANSVALGAGSATSAAHTGDYTLNTSYTAAGLPVAANGTVSVGSAGKERQIQNVAAGVISATSTDAINGSQLYATNNYLSNLAGGVKNVLGGDAAVDNAGNLTMSDVGGTGKGNVHEAIAAVKGVADTAVQEVESENPTALSVKKDGTKVTLTPNFITGDLVNADGTVNAPAAADEGKLVSAKTVADALKANHFLVDTKANGGKTEAGSEENAKVGSSNKVTFEAGKNLVAQQTNTANGGATVNYKLSDTLENLVSVKSAEIEAGIGPNKVVLNNNGVKVGDSTLNDKGLTINNGPSVTDAGINAGDKKITGVANGDVSTGSTDAVNGGQLAEVKAKADSAVQDVKSGDENALTAEKDPNTNIVTVTPKLSGDLVDTNGNITAPATPADKGKLVTAGTVAEALANTHFVVDTKATDGELDAASQADQKIKASNKVTLQAGKNLKAKQTNGANGAEVEFSLKDSISLKEVKVGEGSANEVVLNNNGVNVAGNTYINKDGLNANDKKITNVAPGAVTAASKDAVNGSQLYNVANNVKDLIGPDAAIDPATGKVTVADPAKGIGETGKGNIGDAIKHVNDAAKAAAETAAKHTTVVEGKNVKVTKGKNAAGGDEYTVATKDDLDVTSVTAGNTTVNTNGLTITGGPSVTRGGIDAGNRVISGVKAGDVSATSQEAVNGSQLHATNTKLDGVKAKADTAVQDVKSGDEKALTVTRDANTNVVTVTPKLSGDLVDADGNISKLPTPEDKGKLVTAGTVAEALANTHFVVNTEKTDGGELDTASQANQKIKASNKVTLQAGKNLKAKQTNSIDGAQVEFSLKDNISLTSLTAATVTAGTGDNQVVLNDTGVNVGNKNYINKDGLNANGNKITNVKAGDVSENSTDAVNGAQLNATNAELAKVKGVSDTAVQEVESENPTALSVKKDGTKVTLTPNFIAGDLVNADGTVKDPAAADEGKLVSAKTVADALKANHFVVDTKANGGTVDAASEKNAKVGSGNKVTFEAGKNLVAQQTNTANGGATVNYKLSDTLENLVSVKSAEIEAGIGPNKVVLNNNGVKVGDSTLNDKGLTINNGPSVTDAGINAGDKKITGVADGNVATGSKDAVNGGQLAAVKATADSAVKSVTAADGEQNLVVDNRDSKNPKLSLNKDLTVDSVKAGDTTLGKDGLTIAGGPSVKKDGINAGGKAVTNVGDGKVEAGSKDAVNGGQLFEVAQKANGAVQDIKSGNEKALSVEKKGNTYTITPNLIGELVDADGNITAPATPEEKGKLVTAGTVADALANTHFVVDTKATDGELDTASQADQKIKAGNKVTFQAGKNLKAKQTNGDNGAEVEFSLKDDVTVKTVTADNVKANKGIEIVNGPSMTKDGINAGGKAITNVGKGMNETDAVNKGQLDDVAKNVAGLVGPDAKFDPATGKVTLTDPAKGIAGTGKTTIGEAIQAATAAANTKVTNGSENITVTPSDNADGSKTYTVDVSAKTKASLAKADSAVQGLTSKDGNLNFTKGANGNVEVSFNDNLNVKNVTTDRVQVANGPSMSKDGINAAGKAISNVANGNVAADSKDAVNGGQLHETAKSVADVIGGGATVKDGKVVAGQNGIGNTGQNTVHGAIAAINQNTANNFNQIRGDLRKMDRDLRGGIAGALATAGLPQAFRPGKSMVAAAASTYRGQSGLAIGVSRISDNGKVILKVTGNTNSRGDFGGTIGAGYQW